jgi:hypothetical protein
MKWVEGRTSIFGIHSAAGKRRLAKQKKAEEQGSIEDSVSTKAGSSEEKLDETVEGLSTRPVFKREDTSAHEPEIHEA